MATSASLVYSELAAIIVIGIALAMCWIALRRHLPRHNVAAAFALAAVFFWMLETVNAGCDWPFGPAAALGVWELPGGITLASVLFWMAGLLASRLLARRLLRPWRKRRSYGYWMVLLATLLAVLLYRVVAPFPAGLEPDFVFLLLATGATCLAALVVVAPWLIVKSAHSPPADWLGPSAWLGLCAYFGLRALNLGWANAWLAAALLLLLPLAIWLTHRRAEDPRASR